jgi:hypothetical protein
MCRRILVIRNTQLRVRPGYMHATVAQTLQMHLDWSVGSRHLWIVAADSHCNHGAYKIVGNSVACRATNVIDT